MMKHNDFAVFILTYGRADKVFTYNTLRKFGYTGKIYLVCSTDDKTLQSYKDLYGDDVIVFDKNDYKGTFDIGDNFDKMNVVVYARNANFDIARKVGVKYFLQLDDDYTNFQYKIPTPTKLQSTAPKNLDKIFDIYLDFLTSTPVTSVALAQGGDFIGGKDNPFFWRHNDGRKRKLMNCYFNDVDRPYQFYGRINEDVNCYVQNGKLGYIFITHPYMSIVQPQTQTNSGGLTEFYKDLGTYVKSFYTVLYNPSAVEIRSMGRTHRRLHHSIRWKYAIPQIISQEYKKY